MGITKIDSPSHLPPGPRAAFEDLISKLSEVTPGGVRASFERRSQPTCQYSARLLCLDGNGAPSHSVIASCDCDGCGLAMSSRVFIPEHGWV